MVEKRILERAIIREGATIRDALVSLNESACQIVLVLDADGRLIGLMTDGDLRRAMLAGATLADGIGPHLRRSFTSVQREASRVDVLDLMRALRISEVPIVDAEGRLVGLHLMHDVVGRQKRPNWAVVMAGGRGTRLAPLTDSIPKPMVKVAGRPILERIILSLVGAGITRVFLSIHHLGEVIERHFGDGAHLGCQIHYLREETPLGTAGALSLLPERPPHALLVMNGDLMTQADIGSMLDAHERAQCAATVAVRRYTHTVPFGCVELDGTRVVGIEEKPAIHKLINAGIYVVEPELLGFVRPKVPTTMPDLLANAIGQGASVNAWEVEDDWIDVGEREQLEKARGLR
jgi:dTDP-glucose pyrophosphorylase